MAGFRGQWWVLGSLGEPGPRAGGRAQPIRGSLRVGVLVPGLLTRAEGGLGSTHVSRETGKATGSRSPTRGSGPLPVLNDKVLAVADG